MALHHNASPITQSALNACYQHPAMNAWGAFVLGEYTDMMTLSGAPRTKIEPPSLLDTLEAWVVYGDAVEQCETFENYLVIVITILAVWVDHGDPETWHTGVNFLEGFGDVDDPVLNEHTPISRLQAQAWRHPALSRTVWDVAVAGRVQT